VPLSRPVKLILIFFCSVVMLASAAYWVLLHPRNFITRQFGAKATDLDANVILGPYPEEIDLKKLQARGVTKIVSLLNPALPYENTILQREKESAAKLGLALENYPMTSVAGQRFGDEYDATAERAAKAATSGERVYLHCYLGVHRARAVEEKIRAAGTKTAVYEDRKSERSQSASLLDAAEAAYNSGNFKEAHDKLASAKDLNPTGRLLLAWSNLKLGNTIDARKGFEELVTTGTESLGARTGLGYSALRGDDLAEADKQFRFVLQNKSDDLSALEGLGIVRYRQGHHGEAAQLLRKVTQADPKNDEARALLQKVQPSDADTSHTAGR
jgi:tetratricopeptide (TPR) repeat protein